MHDPQYWLERRTRTGRVHIWIEKNDDTLCRMVNAFENLKSFRVTEKSPKSARLCGICLRIDMHQKGFQNSNNARSIRSRKAVDRPRGETQRRGTAEHRRASFVYFVQAGESGPIKVGTSFDPNGRLIELQVANHEPLRLIGLQLGAEPDEARVHAEFADLCIHGEWFRPEPKLLEFIAKATVKTGSYARSYGGALVRY